MEYSHNMNMLLESFGANKELISLLLIDTKDIESFFTGFYTKNKYMIDDLLDFRELKILEDNKDLFSFEADCKEKGVKTAFENTFYQPFSTIEIDFINKAINERKTSLQVIFERFKNNPNVNILKNLL